MFLSSTCCSMWLFVGFCMGDSDDNVASIKGISHIKFMFISIFNSLIYVFRCKCIIILNQLNFSFNCKQKKEKDLNNVNSIKKLMIYNDCKKQLHCDVFMKG